MMDNSIVRASAQFVKELLNEKLGKEFTYHNLKHTERVVKSLLELIEEHDLTNDEQEALKIAGWFHDAGYTVDPSNHEEESVKIAKDFLSKNGVAQDKIDLVTRIILVTKVDAQPTDQLEMIMKDADCSHFGKKNFIDTSDTLKKELKNRGVGEYTESEWQKANIDMLENKHRFYTDFAKENWGPTKTKNLKKLQKTEKAESSVAQKEALKAKYKAEDPEKAVQTMYRVSLRNHLKLSDIADTKANILLSVNAIIISMALSNLIPKLDNPSNYYLIYPSVLFVVVAVVSMVLSVMATRPNVTGGKFSRKDVEDKKVNLLFFGNFHNMSLDDYDWAMTELGKDKDYIYSILNKDLYFLGKVLDKKYRLLRNTYTIFMIGIVLTVIAFAIAFQMQSGQNPVVR